MTACSPVRLLFCAYTAVASVAYAQAPTAIINIHAHVPDACTTNTTDYGTLNFGLHANLTSSIYASSSEGAGSIAVTCTEGLSYSVELDAGQHLTEGNRHLSSKSDQRISYQLFADAQHSDLWSHDTPRDAIGTGLVQQMTIYGHVPRQAIQQPGTYTDNINVTVKW